MSKKTLRMNRFGECILDEIDLFSYSIKNIHQKYPTDKNNDPDVYRMVFSWAWNGYDGYGDIDFYKHSSMLCNVFGENESSMTVSSRSQRQQPNGRSNCALYNDSSLKPLFELILSRSDLTDAMSYDEWIESIQNK